MFGRKLLEEAGKETSRGGQGEESGKVAVLAFGVSLALSSLQMFNCITELVLRAKKDNLAKQQQQQQNDVVKLTKNSKRKKRCC